MGLFPELNMIIGNRRRNVKSGAAGTVDFNMDGAGFSDVYGRAFGLTTPEVPNLSFVGAYDVSSGGAVVVGDPLIAEVCPAGKMKRNSPNPGPCLPFKFFN